MTTEKQPSGAAQAFILHAVQDGSRSLDDLRAAYVAAHVGAKASLELRFNSALMALIRRDLIYRHPVKGWTARRATST